MPADKVICPDGNTCKIDECLNECRIKDKFEAGRCMSLPTLTAVLSERPWKGKPSTTQLLQGTREQFLKITNSYPIDPQQMVFAMYGTAVHARLEGIEVPDALKEERLHDDYSSGAFDYFDKKTESLWDFKTYGSFKAAKILGIVARKIPIGTFKNGNTKYKTMFANDGPKEQLELAIQLNDYRRKLEAHGVPVKNMFCEMLVRDANTVSARNRGIYSNTYVVKIKKISDRWLARWQKMKYDLLMNALSSGDMPAPCRPRERWVYFNKAKDRNVSNKCAKYCQVWMHCDIGRLEHEEDLEDE